MRKPVVIDTNVLSIADGAEGHSAACQERCAKKLFEARSASSIVIDNQYMILREYGRNTRRSRQPGMGHEFFRWLANTATGCERVAIHSDVDKVYQEFPAHPGLTDFDRADRVFVAVALAHGGAPPIMQASDSKWVGWNNALSECNIVVEFVCPEEIQAAHQRRSSRKSLVG